MISARSSTFESVTWSSACFCFARTWAVSTTRLVMKQALTPKSQETSRSVCPVGLPDEGTFDFLDFDFYPKQKTQSGAGRGWQCDDFWELLECPPDAFP